MKKSEIAVNGEYFQDRYQDWGQQEWNCARVRVVSTEVGNWKWDYTANKYIKVVNSSYHTIHGVRVVQLDKKTGEPMHGGQEKVVTMASLRGRWEETYAERSRKWAEKKAAQQAAHAKQAAQQAKIAGIVAAGKELLGGKVNQYGSLYVTLDADVFMQMVTVLGDMGWKPEHTA